MQTTSQTIFLLKSEPLVSLLFLFTSFEEETKFVTNEVVTTETLTDLEEDYLYDDEGEKRRRQQETCKKRKDEKIEDREREREWEVSTWKSRNLASKQHQ